MNIKWVKRVGNVFYGLETLDLQMVREGLGVYVIWHSRSGGVIYVGQGRIAERLSDHRQDWRILSHRGEGVLLVTWAGIDKESERLGVERYLINLWKPEVSQIGADVMPIPVELPKS